MPGNTRTKKRNTLRSPLGEIFDQMVEHKNQRENPDGEGYVSEGTDRNLMASMLRAHPG